MLYSATKMKIRDIEQIIHRRRHRIEPYGCGINPKHNTPAYKKQMLSNEQYSMEKNRQEMS